MPTKLFSRPQAGSPLLPACRLAKLSQQEPKVKFRLEVNFLSKAALLEPARDFLRAPQHLLGQQWRQAGVLTRGLRSAQQKSGMPPSRRIRGHRRVVKVPPGRGALVAGGTNAPPAPPRRFRELDGEGLGKLNYSQVPPCCASYTALGSRACGGPMRRSLPDPPPHGECMHHAAPRPDGAGFPRTRRRSPSQTGCGDPSTQPQRRSQRRSESSSPSASCATVRPPPGLNPPPPPSHPSPSQSLRAGALRHAVLPHRASTVCSPRHPAAPPPAPAAGPARPSPPHLGVRRGTQAGSRRLGA